MELVSPMQIMILTSVHSWLRGSGRHEAFSRFGSYVRPDRSSLLCDWSNAPHRFWFCRPGSICQSSRSVWISTKLFLWISVDHPAAGRCGTWVPTFTDPMIFSWRRVFFPDYFGTDEFVSCDTTFKLTDPFIFHWKGRIIWTAGNAIFINGIVKVFKMCPGFKGI